MLAVGEATSKMVETFTTTTRDPRATKKRLPHRKASLILLLGTLLERALYAQSRQTQQRVNLSVAFSRDKRINGALRRYRWAGAPSSVVCPPKVLKHGASRIGVECGYCTLFGAILSVRRKCGNTDSVSAGGQGKE